MLVIILNIGVAQGSILGPLLFLLYINDLPNCLKSASCILYADDTCLSMAHSDYPTLVEQFNCELESFRVWSVVNRLSVNMDKTFFVSTSNRRDVMDYENPLVYDTQPVKRELSGKYLGVIVDSRFSFAEHINYIRPKLSKSIGILHRLKSLIPSDTLVSLYYSLIYPYLLYCNTVWGGTSRSLLRSLELLQKKAIRIVTNSDYLAHSSPLFHACKILKLNDIYLYNVAVSMFSRNQLSPLPTAQHYYDTRARGAVRAGFRRLTSTQRSLSFMGPTVWNGLPFHIRNAATLNEFKSKLRVHFINQY